jgi:uncharacterized protein (DUF433 family)
MKMQTTGKAPDSKNSINDFLESVSKLSLDDQLMISEIIHKRVIEAKRKEIARSVKESKEEYYGLLKGKEMKEFNRIEINQAILTGKPIIRGTRISIEFIIKLIAQRWTDEQILKEYPVLVKEDIQEALLYAEMLVQNEEVYPILSK